MRRFQLALNAICLAPLVALILAPAALHAESKNPADYPLRLHIFGRSQTTFYHNRYADEAKGDGRANLFENGEAHGVDFTFDCTEKVKDSFGYETYPARWKKPGQELTVLMPVFGKTGSFFTCNFKTDVKNFAYNMRNGRMGQESVDQFKAWMARVNYDPEHGKDVPVKPAPAPGGPAAPPPAAVAPVTPPRD
jgi:hypothetical protein